MRRILVCAILLVSNIGVVLAADTEIVYNKALALFEQEQHEQAIEIWRGLSEQGHLKSIKALGDVYQAGVGVTRDYSEAVRFYRVAAEQDLPEALTAMAGMYFNGQGVSRDYQEGFEYALKAAQLDDANSQFYLAQRFEHGDVVVKNYKEAAKWYGRSSDNGNDYARYRLAMFYANGWGVDTDMEKAFDLLNSAASAGSEAAREELKDATFNNVEIVLEQYKDGYRLALQGINAWLDVGGRDLCAAAGIDSAQDLFWAPYTPTPRIAKSGNAALSAYGGCLVGLQAALQWSVKQVDQDQATKSGALPIPESRKGQVKYKCQLRPDHYDVAISQSAFGASRPLEHLETVLWLCPIEVAGALQDVVDTVKSRNSQVASSSISADADQDITSDSPVFLHYLQSRTEKSPSDATQKEIQQALEELRQIQDLAEKAKGQDIHLNPDVSTQVQLQEAALLAQRRATELTAEQDMSPENFQVYLSEIKPLNEVLPTSPMFVMYLQSRTKKSVAEATVEEQEEILSELTKVVALADEARQRGLASDPSFEVQLRLLEMGILANAYARRQ